MEPCPAGDGALEDGLARIRGRLSVLFPAGK